MTTKLTGELLHEGFVAHRPETALAWESMDDAAREAYKAVAQWTREQLNLCDGCGLQKPPLLEITDLNLCVDCVTPKPDGDGTYVIFDDITEALEVPSEVLIKAAIAELATLGYVALTPEPSQTGWLIFQAPAAFLITCNDMQQLISLVTFAQNTARKEETSDASS